MAPTPKSIMRVLVALSLLTIALPFAASPVGAHHDGTRDPHCDPREGCCDPATGCDPNPGACEGVTSWAAIGNVEANGVTLQTQAGTQTLELPRGLVALAVSTTGTLDVTVDHECVRQYTLIATVQSWSSGTNTYSWTTTPLCVSGSDVYSVPIGMDVASVTLELAWYGCDGTAGKDRRDVTVLDPPLPLDGAARILGDVVLP